MFRDLDFFWNLGVQGFGVQGGSGGGSGGGQVRGVRGVWVEVSGCFFLEEVRWSGRFVFGRRVGCVCVCVGGGGGGRFFVLFVCFWERRGERREVQRGKEGGGGLRDWVLGRGKRREGGQEGRGGGRGEGGTVREGVGGRWSEGGCKGGG